MSIKAKVPASTPSAAQHLKAPAAQGTKAQAPKFPLTDEALALSAKEGSLAEDWGIACVGASASAVA